MKNNKILSAEKTMEEKLAKIRTEMVNNNLDAYIITGFDPHISEYSDRCRRMREIILGFTGSAGTIIILPEFTGLWVDSRYHIQAENELSPFHLAEGTIKIFKEGIGDTPNPIQWLKRQNIKSVGVDGDTVSLSMEKLWREELEEKKISLNSSFQFTAQFILPEEEIHPIWLLPEIYTGKSAIKKLEEIRKYLEDQHSFLDALFISSPVEICWLLNIRGDDIQYNPIVFSFLWIDLNRQILFIDQKKVSSKLHSFFREINIEIFSYDSPKNFISSYKQNLKIGINPLSLNSKIAALLTKNQILIENDIVERLKAVKNSTERENIREAMRLDGKAFLRFRNWFREMEKKKRLEQEKSINEWDCTQKILQFRRESHSFIDESFATISGFNSNGAIVHYTTPEKGSATLKSPGLLLLDSGGHYLHGTTDITRTLYWGDDPVPDEYKKYYTAVLRGHIALATARFPKGTKGYQLDSFARGPLWSIGGDYGHGTGHGVGFCLAVHEGPQRISLRPDNVVLQPGMVVSNEPGYYREGEFGIRIENLLLCKKCDNIPGFLEFETLTYAPYEDQLIEKGMLNESEKKWLLEYDLKIKEILK